MPHTKFSTIIGPGWFNSPNNHEMYAALLSLFDKFDE